MIVGVQTPNCVRSTAVDALGYDFDVVLIADAIGAKTTRSSRANMFDMVNMGATTMTTAAFVESCSSLDPAA